MSIVGMGFVDTAGPLVALALLVALPFLRRYLVPLLPHLADRLPVPVKVVVAIYLLLLMHAIGISKSGPGNWWFLFLLAVGVGLGVYLRRWTHPGPRRSLTVDDNSQASNPGRLRISYLRWLRAFPTAPIRVTALFVLLATLALLVHWIFWIGVVLILPVAAFIVIRAREHFVSGCINPAVVVSQDPPLVAVSTDLSTGGASYPVVKVLTQPLGRLPGGAPNAGTRLATVALYFGTGQSGHWDDFEPVVVNCVTGNQDDIDRVFRSIAIQDWRDLAAGLKQVRTPRTPGLYPVSLAPAGPPSAHPTPVPPQSNGARDQTALTR